MSVATSAPWPTSFAPAATESGIVGERVDPFCPAQESSPARTDRDEPAGNWLFRRWINGAPCSGAVSTNQIGRGLPYQRWYPFKEAFSPKLVAQIIGCSPRKPAHCLDPFGGSGTTALTCQFLGVRPTTIEINPFLADLIRAKLSTYRPDAVITSFRVVRESLDDVEPPDRAPRGPATLCEPGIGGRWIFGKQVFRRVLSYKTAIETACDPEHQPLFRSLLASTLIPMSNVVISGKGRRYRGARSRRADDPTEVDRAFGAAFERAFADICAYGRKLENRFALHCADSRIAIDTVDEVDLVITSPPYPNSFDYSDVYNVELWMLGYLETNADNHRLRSATLRSHVQIKRDFSYCDFDSRSLRTTVGRLEAAAEKLWSPFIPAMIGAYFGDLLAILQSARDKLRDGGQIVLAVGDSQYAGVVVDVARILAEMAPAAGLRLDLSTPVREMRTSAQQGGQERLKESLLFFKKRQQSIPISRRRAINTAAKLEYAV